MLLLHTVVMAVAAAGPPTADRELKINEVLVAPVAGEQIVEITNLAAIPLETSTVLLATGVSFQQLPPTTLAPGGFLRLHIGLAGTNTPTDLFLPGVASFSTSAGSLALYVAPVGGVPQDFFQEPGNIRDFVQWGAAQQPLSSVAEAGHVWFFASTFVPTPAVGETIAWAGGMSQPINWFRDVSPTLGGANVQPTADRSIFGFQCSPAAAGPYVSLPTPPALGNRDFRIGFWTQSVSQPAALIVGLGTASIPIFQGAYGQCFLYVQPVSFAVPFVSPALGSTSFAIPVPDLPGLIGSRLVFQAAVINGFGIPVGGLPVDLSAAAVVDF